MRRSPGMAAGLVLLVAMVGGAAPVAQKSDGPSGPPPKPSAAAAEKPVAAPPAPAILATPAPIPAPAPSPSDQPIPDSEARPRDPTEPQQPLLDVYALSKGPKSLDMPALELVGRILSGKDAAALLGVEGQPRPILVREGITLSLSGPKYGNVQVRVVKVDELGLHLSISRFGQSSAAAQPLVLY